MLLIILDGILNYCRTKVRFGVVEAINGNIKTLLRRGRGYKNLGYLLLKAQTRWPSPKPNSSFFRRQPKMPVSTNSCSEPNNVTTLEITKLPRYSRKSEVYLLFESPPCIDDEYYVGLFLATTAKLTY